MAQSLEAFRLHDIVYLKAKSTTKIRELLLPTDAALTGNYNDIITRCLRSLFWSNCGYRSRLGEDCTSAEHTRSAAELGTRLDIICARRTWFRSSAYRARLSSIKCSYCLTPRFWFLIMVRDLPICLFMRPGSKAMQLRREGDAHNNCYFSLAGALGLRYFYQLCPAVSPLDGDSDIVVCPESFRGNLKRGGCRGCLMASRRICSATRVQEYVRPAPTFVSSSFECRSDACIGYLSLRVLASLWSNLQSYC